MHTIQKEDDNVYINVIINGVSGDYSLTPNGPSIGVHGVEAKYNVCKSGPILEKSSDFFCSVIRFTCPLNDIPLFIFPIIPNQVNPNKSTMVIGINYNGINNSTNVIYIPDNLDTPPVQNLTIQVITPYYYVYDYQNFITIINSALLTVYNSSGLAALFPTALPPYFSFDSSTNLISIIIPSFFVTLTAPAVGIPIIYMNDALAHYLESFETLYRGSNELFGRDYDFIFPPANQINDKAYALFGTVYPPNPGPGIVINLPQYYKIPQNYITLQSWNSLSKLILTSNNIPIRNEIVPVGGNNNSGLLATFPIITDFVPQFTSLAGESRTIAYYLPSAQYKLIDLISDSPLYNIDIRILWQDLKGNLYPLYIFDNHQAEIKIAFIRKTLYKGYNKLLK